MSENEQYLEPSDSRWYKIQKSIYYKNKKNKNKPRIHEKHKKHLYLQRKKEKLNKVTEKAEFTTDNIVIELFEDWIKISKNEQNLPLPKTVAPTPSLFARFLMLLKS